MSALDLASPELVLKVNERQQFRRAFAPFGRRALRRRLSVVAARLERTAGYQSSLQRVLAASEHFQRTLGDTQRSAWLTLEDALHDHTWRSNRAFFRAGVELGWRLANARETAARQSASSTQRRTQKCQRATAPTHPTRDDVDVILSLLQIIRRLLER